MVLASLRASWRGFDAAPHCNAVPRFSSPPAQVQPSCDLDALAGGRELTATTSDAFDHDPQQDRRSIGPFVCLGNSAKPECPSNQARNLRPKVEAKALGPAVLARGLAASALAGWRVEASERAPSAQAAWIGCRTLFERGRLLPSSDRGRSVIFGNQESKNRNTAVL